MSPRRKKQRTERTYRDTVGVSQVVPRPFPFGLTVLALLLPCLLTVIVYVWDLNNVFVLDDHVQVVENNWASSVSAVPDLFTRSYARLSEELGYRPVLTLSYIAERMMWGALADEPTGYHVTNIAIHLANVILCFFLARLIFHRTMPSMIAATIFAIHPINSEVVIVLTYRDDSLSLLFVLAGLLVFARGERSGRPLSLSIVGALLFFIGSLVKEQAALFPLLLFVWWLAFERGKYRKQQVDARFVLSLVPYAFVALVFLVMRLHFSSTSEQIAGSGQAPMFQRILTAPSVIAHYFRMMFIPFNQSSYYPAQSWNNRVFSCHNIGAAVVVIAFLVLTAASYRRWKIGTFCGAWFLILALPVINVVPINNFAAYDRYMYLSSIAFAIFASALFFRLHCLISRNSSRAKSFFVLLLSVYFVCLGTQALKRVFVWKDGLTFWKNALLVSPDVGYVYKGYGTGLYRLARRGAGDTDKGLSDLATEKWKKALKLSPDSPRVLTSIATIYLKQERFVEAIELFEKALRITSTNYAARINLGDAYREVGEIEKAIELYKKTIRVFPDAPEAYNNLADIYTNSDMPAYRRPTQAVQLAEKACQVSRWQIWECVLTLGEAHYAAGNRSEAIRYTRKALEIDPGNEVLLDFLKKFERSASGT